MKRIRRFLLSAICVSILTVMSISSSVNAADIGNAQVKEASKGVIQVLVTYVDADNTEWIIQSGSGFFIGSEAGADTIVTNHHVISIDDETREAAKQTFGRDIINDVSVKIVVDRDLTKTATVSELNSADYDIAVLKLEEPLSGMSILTLSEEEPQKTQDVYALGFPDLAQIVKDKQFYTSDDVTITSGTISDVTEIGQTQHIQHECKLSSGNSGGPLLNEAGEVVGVNRSDVDDKYYYSVKISELTKLLDKMSIPYNSVSGGPTEPDESDEALGNQEEQVNKAALESAIKEAKEVDKQAYTQESIGVLEAAIEDGETVLNDADASQEEVDSAADDIKDAQGKLEEQKGLPIALLMGIGAVVIAIIVIVIIIVVKSGKKKNKQPVQADIQKLVPPERGFSNEVNNMPGKDTWTPPVVIDTGGSDETSVLNEGAGQTTVLSAQAVPTATLRRVSNGETAIINKQGYKMGKEKKKVDFCVSNNSSISRVHAEITYENGMFYIADQNATNFTFVNGNKVNPGQKVKISNGDKIKLSDEEFEFKA